ncbi:MAG: addiction module protein [Coriobacteriia bacterium]
MTSPAIDIEKLDPEERLRLIGELWESLRAHPETVPVTRVQRSELDRRLDAVDNDESESIPWDVVKSRLQGESG